METRGESKRREERKGSKVEVVEREEDMDRRNRIDMERERR